ncbi:Uncharacterised protein [Providencia rustigianii]|uniref:hypothetical protein n=1 Tax=Providencia TaxID=586 RepID=UPI000F6FCA01|nr:Uncharacterised protein [Providencia rustigianii]
MKLIITKNTTEPDWRVRTPYEIQGEGGDYFIVNHNGRVYWLDDLANEGIEWEYIK